MTIQGMEEAEIADKKMTHRNSPRGHALRRHEQTSFCYNTHTYSTLTKLHMPKHITAKQPKTKTEVSRQTSK